jgi:hypothetical protein
MSLVNGNRHHAGYPRHSGLTLTVISHATTVPRPEVPTVIAATATTWLKSAGDQFAHHERRRDQIAAHAATVPSDLSAKLC